MVCKQGLAWYAGVHVGRRQVNLDCDDPAPDADMDQDEYADYELEDYSDSAPNSSWHGADSSWAPAAFTPGIAPGLAPSALPAPAATAGSTCTWLPAGTPSQHAASGMPHVSFPPPIMYNGHPQLAANGAFDHSVPQPAGYPGAESGFAHQSREHGKRTSRGGKKRKNQDRSEGQKRIKPGGPFSKAQLGTAQPQTLVWGCNAELDAVANAAVAATAVGEAKLALGPAAAAPAVQKEPSANAGFARSSYGSPSVQETVRHGGIHSNNKFSF